MKTSEALRKLRELASNAHSGTTCEALEAVDQLEAVIEDQANVIFKLQSRLIDAGMDSTY